MKKLFFLACIIAATQLAAQTKQEAALIKKTKDFYAWYKKNPNKLDNFKLHGSKTKDDAGPYFIIWKNVEKYFAYIRKSVPMLGEAYIENERKDLKELDKYYKENLDDGIPAGFDADRIVGGQVGVDEALEYAFPKQGKWKVSIDGNTATVAWVHKTLNYDTNEMEETSSTTELKKEKGIWKISKTLAMTYKDEYAKEDTPTNTI
jgi:hypothetical protein